MEVFYYVVFGVAAACAAFFEFFGKKETAIFKNEEFSRFKTNYVVVYSLMMAGDWLQGPYVYALYEYYNYTVGDIGRLFIAGFGSSMVFGTIVGSLADRHGRKKAGLIYVLTYAGSCVTKHWSSYQVLMFGRILGGIATSLLFSAFESWLVAEHFKHGFDEEWLGSTFSLAVFFGNGLVAIVSGLLANTLVENFALGPVAPFDAAFTVLLIGGAIIFFTWPENYGQQNVNKGALDQFKEAFSAIRKDHKIALLGAMQSLFEASMYTFVFLWTPALSPKGEKIPHGFIFACFMVTSMGGSALAGKLLNKQWTNMRVEMYMQYVFLWSAACLVVPVLFHIEQHEKIEDAGGITFEGCVQMVAFCAFEGLVGIFWPSMMTMRAHYVPEELRATIINYFRIPLNLFVCIVLYNVHAFPLSVMFGLCSCMLFVAFICQRILLASAQKQSVTKDSESQKLIDT